MQEKDYEVDVSWNEDILWIVITGKASEQNASEISRVAFEAAAEARPTKVLIDCTKLEGRLSVVDTYYHVREYPSQAYQVARSAIVDSPDNVTYYSFHETAAANVGAHMKYFTDTNEALGWLNQ